MAKKKKERDKLSLDMIECKKAGYGCHYGDWYAAQNRPVIIEKKTVVPDGYNVCPRCGKVFKPKTSKHIYCEVGCQRASHRERNKDKYSEYYRTHMAKKREEQRRARDGNDPI